MEINFDSKTWGNIGAVVAIVLLFAFACRWESRRKQGLRDFARRERLSYLESEAGDHAWDERPESGIVKRFHFLNPLKKGTDHNLSPVISGEYRGHEVLAFDMVFQKRKSSDSDGVCLLLLEKEFPALFVWDKELVDEMGKEGQQKEITIPDPAFAAKLSVFSNDEALALAFCHPRMREFLLRQECLTLQLQGKTLATSGMAVWDAEELKTQLDILIEVKSLMPASLLAD